MNIISDYRAVSPLNGEDFYADESVIQMNGTSVKTIITVCSEDMHKLGGVVVEAWDHVVGNQSSGSKRRAYHKEFTDSERKKIGAWKARYWKWEIRSGYPIKGVAMSRETHVLLVRAADFFASI